MDRNGALQVLDLATQPENIGRLTRADFCNVEAALSILSQTIKHLEELLAENESLRNQKSQPPE